jgi:hypothetical protein
VREWLIPEAFEILKVMLEVAGRKGAYFAMMTAVTVAAFLALWKYRHPFARLGVIAATCFIGFNLVLWVLYITAFERLNALHAVSFWRFNTQLGLLGCAAAAYGFALLWRSRMTPLHGFAQGRGWGSSIPRGTAWRR